MIYFLRLKIRVQLLIDVTNQFFNKSVLNLIPQQGSNFPFIPGFHFANNQITSGPKTWEECFTKSIGAAIIHLQFASVAIPDFQSGAKADSFQNLFIKRNITL